MTSEQKLQQMDREQVRITKKQASYLWDKLVGLNDVGRDNWGSDYYLADAAEQTHQEIRQGWDDPDQRSDGSVVVTVNPYIIWRLEADVERMHPSQSDSDWTSVQEYSYALRFLRKMQKAAGLPIW